MSQHVDAQESRLMTVRIKLPPVTMSLPLNSRDGQFVDYLSQWGLAGIDEGEVGYVRGPTPCVVYGVWLHRNERLPAFL